MWRDYKGQNKQNVLVTLIHRFSVKIKTWQIYHPEEQKDDA